MYCKILIELGEVLERIKSKLNVEYSNPSELAVADWFTNLTFICKLKRVRKNNKSVDSEFYVSPSMVQEEIQEELNRRVKYKINITGSVRLSVKVTENNSKFYTIYIKVGK